MVAAAASIAAHDPQPLQCVVGHCPPSSLDLDQIADQRRAVNALDVGLAPIATESIPEVIQHEVSVWLGIVGARRWGRHEKTLTLTAILR